MAIVTEVDERANIRDYMLGLDDLQQPRIIDMSVIKPNEWNSAILFIVRLLLMVPGVQEDRPNMGIDIKGRYTFSFEEELYMLNQEIEEQVGVYCPELTPIGVNCYMETRDNGSYLIISIVIDEVDYRIMYDINNKTLVGLEEL